MKYHFISHEGPFRNNLVPGKDIDRIIREKNKIIITRIKGKFHVLICRNGVFEKEKHIMSYFELVKFLKGISFNAYFVNVPSETAYNIHSYVKKDDEYCKENNVVEKPKALFTINNGNILKMEVFIKRDIIKSKLEEVFNEEIKDDSKTQTLNLIDFVENRELFELCNYPINEKNGKFTVPDYSYAKPNLYYMLSSIYSKDGEFINLTSDDLENLYLAKFMNSNIIDDIIKYIDVNVIDIYNLDEFSKSVEFINSYQKQKKDVHIKLLLMRNSLMEAKKNTKYVNSLGLLQEEYKLKSDKVIEKRFNI